MRFFTLLLICLFPLVVWASPGMGPGPGLSGSSVVKGFVGNESGSQDGTDTISAIDVGSYTCFSATTTGTVTYIHALVVSAGNTYNAAIYNSARDTKLGDGTLTTGPGTGQINIALDSGVSVTQGTTYCLSIGSHTDSYWQVRATNNVSYTVRQATSYTVGDSMPTTLPTGSTTQQYYELIIWADGDAT